MVIKNEELIHEFYSEVSEDYPDLNLEDMKEGIFGPWRFLRSEMEDGELHTVRFKYFGTFQVYEGRAKHMLLNLKERKRYNKIDKKKYDQLTTMIKAYLKRIENVKN